MDKVKSLSEMFLGESIFPSIQCTLVLYSCVQNITLFISCMVYRTELVIVDTKQPGICELEGYAITKFKIVLQF